MDVDNTQDVLDSRDVIARIEELESQATDEDYADEFGPDEQYELESLRALAEQGQNCEDWWFGAQLVRDSYFEDYARELADGIGAIDRNATWPVCHIDWEAAASSLQMDYTSVKFDGVTYWVR